MSLPHIIISRSRGADRERRSFEDRLCRELVETHGVSCLIASHLYDLTDGASIRSRVAPAPQALAVAGWLYPRALEWIARALLDDERTALTAFDLREYGEPGQAARDLALALSAGSEAPEGEAATVADLSAVSAAERWYPVIDYSRCTHCGQCLGFCLFHVYARGEAPAVRVVAPDNCKPGCPACSRVCPQGAIVFPHYDADRAIAGAPGATIVAMTSRDKESLLQKARALHPEVAAPAAAAPRPSGASDGGGDELDWLINALEEREN